MIDLMGNVHTLTRDLSLYLENRVRINLSVSGVDLSLVLGFGAAYICYYLSSVTKIRELSVHLENYINPFGLKVLLGCIAAYILFYLSFISRKPQLITGGQTLCHFLTKYCPVVTETYYPTFWCSEGRMQTLLRPFITSKPSMEYRNELIKTADGGQISLDWIDNEGSLLHPVSATRPIVLILPGLTGTSKESYILHMVKESQSQGYRCTVVNNRGVSGERLLTPRTYCAANTEDLETVIAHVQKRFSEAPLIAAGVSMGGMLLLNYLGKIGRETPLKAAVVFSVGWDVFECTASLEKPLNWILFNYYLTTCLRASISRHKQVLEKLFNLDYVLKAKSIREFDERLTSVMFGYPSNSDYYKDASPCHKLKSIEVPVLCLNALDDVFSPGHAIPKESAKQNPYVSLLLTSHGGHIGFLEGIFPRQTTYMDRVFKQFVQAVIEHGDELRTM